MGKGYSNVDMIVAPDKSRRSEMLHAFDYEIEWLPEGQTVTTPFTKNLPFKVAIFQEVKKFKLNTLIMIRMDNSV